MSNLTDVLIRGLLHSWQLPPSPSLPEIPLCVCTQFLPHLFSVLLACFHCCFTVTLYLPSSLYLHSSLSVPHHSAVISLTFLFISHSLSYSIDRYRSHTRRNLINSDNGSYFYRCNTSTHAHLHQNHPHLSTHPLKSISKLHYFFFVLFSWWGGLKKLFSGHFKIVHHLHFGSKIGQVRSTLHGAHTHTELSNQLLRDINFHSKYTLTKWLTNKLISSLIAFFFIFPSLWNYGCTLTCRHLQTCMLTLQSSSSSHLRSSIKHTAVSKCELFMQRCEPTAHISQSHVEILSCWPFCLFCMANMFTLTLIF